MRAGPFDEPAPGVLCLEDGTRFAGQLVGAAAETLGEACFTTSMTGYQQVVSDPSFCEQIVCMTAPMVGNHGVDQRYMESGGPQVAGLVMRHADETWCDWLAANGVVALSEVDTRSLTAHLREHGAMRGAISRADRDADELLQTVRAWPSMLGRSLVAQVSGGSPVEYNASGRVGVAVVDYGVKRSLLRALAAAGAKVTVHPHDVDAPTLLAHDAVVLSSGPGDPAALVDEIEVVQQVVGRRPVFGVCLGHQVLALATGERTRKMPTGHRGANHPVLERSSGSVLVTSQNHGFEVEVDDERVVSHHSLYDMTVEGIHRPELQARSVQFHPEAGPGPRDAGTMLGAWIDEVVSAS